MVSFAISPAMADCCVPASGENPVEYHFDKTDESGKKEAGAHHCASCHHHVTDRVNHEAITLSLKVFAAPVPIHREQLGAPIVTGPLLEPPAHV